MLSSIIIDGITLCCLPWLLVAAHFPRRAHGRPRKILVIQLGKIGDLVCTTPLFRSLKTSLMEHSVTVLCFRRTSEVLRENPFVDAVLLIDEERYSGIWGKVRLLTTLYRTRYDVSVAPLPGAWNAIIGLWTRAPIRLHTRGGRMGLAGYFFHLFHTHRVAYRRGTRTFDHYMLLANSLGAKPVPYKHDFFLTHAEVDRGHAWLLERGIGAEDSFVIFSLTAGNRMKEWPLNRFTEVARAMLKNHRVWILFSSERKEITAAATAECSSPSIVDAGGVPLRLLAAIIQRAKLFLSVDTGPLYIAHALDVPIVDIVGPVDPSEQPPPPGPRVALVLPPSSIQPSSFVAETLRIPTQQQRAALDGTTPAQVSAAVERLLRRTSPLHTP